MIPARFLRIQRVNSSWRRRPGYLNGFSIVDPIMASLVIAIAVFLAVSGTGYIVNTIRAANERGVLDADMQSYAALLKEKANHFHYCGSGYTVETAGCNGGNVGESNLYFHETIASDGFGYYQMDIDCFDGTLQDELKAALDAQPVPDSINREITVDSAILVTVELSDKNSKYPARLLKIYPAVASFCPT